ncbi:hypothetical protein DFH27DRAFT_554576 [Peziza echinospora]|nr:hypothetical protein DFH27DRAFT_554576 [Peziza echinospora]
MHTILRSRPSASSFTIASATTACTGCFAYPGGRGIEEARRDRQQQQQLHRQTNQQNGQQFQQRKHIPIPSPPAKQGSIPGNAERKPTRGNNITLQAQRDNAGGRGPECGCTLVANGRPSSTPRLTHKRQLGEFYVRFYSTMTGDAWENTGRPPKVATRDYTPIRRTVSATPSSPHSHPDGSGRLEIRRVMGSKEETPQAGDRPIDHGEPGKSPRDENDRRQLASEREVSLGYDVNDPTSTFSTPRSWMGTRPRLDAGEPRSARSRAYIDPIASVKSSVAITDAMLEHQRLGDELRLRLNRKLEERDNLEATQGYWDKQAALTFDIEMLKDTWRHINERTVVQTAEAFSRANESELEAIDTIQENAAQVASREAQTKAQRDYIPPFPNYRLDKPPILLNMSLRRLMSQRPVPMNIIPKVCFNLLTSNSAPDTLTYNILIHNFVLLRQNTLAEITFQEMIKSGDTPDEYTIVALLNLMVKTGDFLGWKKIVDLQKNEEPVWKKKKGRVRSKHLIETLIIHAARFGDRRLILKYTRILRSYWPLDPEPGVEVQTALIRFYAEMHEFQNGRRCWMKLIDMENAAKEEALVSAQAQPGGENATLESVQVNVIDERAWYWWLWHCERCGRIMTRDRWAEVARKRGINVDKVNVEGPEKTKALHARRTNKSPALGEHEHVGDWLRVLQQQRLSSGDGGGTPGQFPGVFLVSVKQKRLFQKKLSQVVFKAMLRPQPSPPPPEITLVQQVREMRKDQRQQRQQNNQGLDGDKPPRIIATTGYHDLTWDALEEVMPFSTPDQFTTTHDSKNKKKEKFMSPHHTISSTAPLISESQKASIWQNLITRRLDILHNRQKALYADSLNGKIRLTPDEERRGKVLERWRRKFRDADDCDFGLGLGEEGGVGGGEDVAGFRVEEERSFDHDDVHYGTSGFEDDEDDVILGVRPLRKLVRKKYI